jgi:protein-tyrosine-phosphatase
MKTVLFVCNHNTGRSQMAQAFFERLGPDDVRAESAGSDPARQVWPEVVEVMRELNVDIADRKPKRLLVEMQLHADWAVTMGCGDACPYVPTTVEDWDIPTPPGARVEQQRYGRDPVTRRGAVWSLATTNERPLQRLAVPARVTCAEVGAAVEQQRDGFGASGPGRGVPLQMFVELNLARRGWARSMNNATRKRRFTRWIRRPLAGRA